MPINTSVTSNVGRVDRPASSGGIVNRNEGGASSPFQPETRVDIENSIKNMLSLLTKTGMDKGMPSQKLPEVLQKMVDDLMQNNFSLDASLSQGIGNVLQSQKTTIDQLNLLSKFIDQIGELIENNELSNLPDTLKTFFANLKVLDGNGGKWIDTSNLAKLALQILDGKSMEDFPEALQFLLMQNPGNLNVGAQQANEMTFLKQLAKFFFPAPSEGESAQGQKGAKQSANQPANQQAAQGENSAAAGRQNTAGQPEAGKAAASEQAGGKGQASAEQGKGADTNAAQSKTPGGAVGQSGAKSPLPGQQNQPGANTGGNQAAPGQSNQAGQASQTGSQTARQAGQSASQGTAAQNTQSSAENAGLNLQKEQPGKQNQMKGQEGAQQNSSTAMNRPAIQNTQETMRLMKDMAQQMLSKPELSQHEFNVLRNFINGKQTVLGDQEVKQLQVLLRLSAQNVPASVRQAAINQDIPDLPKLWAFVQLCNLTRLLELPAKRLKNASKDINDFANMLKKTTRNENEASGPQRSISFMTPLYLGDNEHCYPTYIHMYHESEEENGRNPGEDKKETWLRLCLLTEYVGAVELVFRLYERENVNLRVSFSSQEAVESFNEYIPQLQNAFEELPLNLTDVKVGAIGG